MGLNAYFTYQVVGFHGNGTISYGLALTAVFIEGLIFMLLALTGMRQWLVKVIPTTIKTASGVGIGLFLTEIGLSYSAGIGAITGGQATPLMIGGCSPGNINDQTGECERGIMSSPTVSYRVTAIIQVILLKYRAVDVARYLHWRHFHGVPDDLQGQDGNSHWDRTGFYLIMAVSRYLTLNQK